MSRKRKKKKSLRNTLINIVATLLIILSLLLIFNAPIRNMIMVWHTNQYQVSKVDKRLLIKTKKWRRALISNMSSHSRQRPWSMPNGRLKTSCNWGISIPELNMNLPIFKGLENVALYYGAGTMKENQVMGQGNYSLASHHVFGLTGANAMLFSPLRKPRREWRFTSRTKKNLYLCHLVCWDSDSRPVDVIQDREGVNEITLVTFEDAAATYRTIVKGIWKLLLTMTRLQKTSWIHSARLIIKCNFKKIKPMAEMPGLFSM